MGRWKRSPPGLRPRMDDTQVHPGADRVLQPMIPNFCTLFPLTPIVLDLTCASMVHKIESKPVGTFLHNPSKKSETIGKYIPPTNEVQVTDHQMESSATSAILNILNIQHNAITGFSTSVAPHGPSSPLPTTRQSWNWET